MSKHTPTPWEAVGCTIFETARECQPVQVVGNTHNTGRDEAEDEANAAFIARACNAHEGLVEALTNLTKMVEDGDWTSVELVEARAALAQAQDPKDSDR